MRALLKAVLTMIAAVAAFLLILIVWFYYFQSDLPDTKALARFAPSTITQTSPDRCFTAPSVAVPYAFLGENLKAALRVAEVSETDHRALAVQISRTMFCEPSRTLKRELNELRTAIQLERHFSRQELFTIYANRAYFGEGLIGIDAASRHFYNKSPDKLTIAEAALIAGLIRAPTQYSPVSHADRALQRRNQVIDAMRNAHFVGTTEAEIAKAAPLGIVGN